MNSKTKVRHVERLGIEAVTTIQSRAFFFLFVEIYPNKFYSHDIIRISNKKNDSKECWWYNADFDEVHKVSQDLLSLYETKFNMKIPCPNTVKTKIEVFHYEDLEIN